MTDEEWEQWKEVVGITDATSGEVNTNGEWVMVRRDDLAEILRITDRKVPLWDRLRAALEA